MFGKPEKNIVSNGLQAIALDRGREFSFGSVRKHVLDFRTDCQAHTTGAHPAWRVKLQHVSMCADLFRRASERRKNAVTACSRSYSARELGSVRERASKW